MIKNAAALFGLELKGNERVRSLAMAASAPQARNFDSKPSQVSSAVVPKESFWDVLQGEPAKKAVQNENQRPFAGFTPLGARGHLPRSSCVNNSSEFSVPGAPQQENPGLTSVGVSKMKQKSVALGPESLDAARKNPLYQVGGEKESKKLAEDFVLELLDSLTASLAESLTEKSPFLEDDEDSEHMDLSFLQKPAARIWSESLIGSGAFKDLVQEITKGLEQHRKSLQHTWLRS